MSLVRELRDRLAWKYHCVFPQTAAKLVEHGAVLIDVRDESEWRAGHVPLAVHIPLDELERRQGELPDERPVILVSRSGRRAKRAAALLAGRGCHASNLTGGMHAWARAGLPVTDATGEADRSPSRARERPSSRLPQWQSVLAVVAHPDDESFGLGAVLAALTTAGTRATVLCLTHGEASTLHEAPGDLFRVRAREFAAAAQVLGAEVATLRHYPDGQLAATCPTTLVGEVLDAARDARADGLLAFDPCGLTGHPDHMAATQAARAAGEILDLPVLGWTIADDVATILNTERGASFVGHRADEIDFSIEVERDRQLAAIAEHTSQAAPSSVLWRRLALQGNTERLRWLRPPRGRGID